MIDSVDAAGDSFDVFDDRNEPCATAIWNGRLVNIPGPMPQYPSKLFQFSPQTNPFPHHVEQLDLSDEPSEFVFAPTTFSHEFTFQSPVEIFLSKGFFHRLYHEVKEGAKKVGKLAKKALKAITHGTKKAAHKVEHFVKDHKKEILIATAVIAAVSGAFALSGALGTSAAAVSNPPKKKEEEEEKKTSASPPPPPPLPDWVQGLLQSTAPNFSPETASDAEIEQAKSEAHNAWETLNHIKALTEADLAHLRKEDPDFDPTKTAIETVLNTVLSDAQRHEFSKTSAAQQHWQDLIRTGHERIDQGFSAVAAHKAAAIAPPPPLPLAPTFSFIDKIKLGLEIIGRGMMEPELLDTNTRLDVFLKDQKITAPPIDNPNQTVSEFINKIKEGLGTIGRGAIDPELLDPNSPWDLFLQNQIENREKTISEFVNKIKLTFDYIGRASIEPELLDPNSPWDLFLQNQMENRDKSISEFVNKIKLSLDNIGRASIDPELLDPNSPWDRFLQQEMENRDKTISEFINKIKLSLDNIGRASIDPELLDPNSAWDLFLQNQIENRNQTTPQVFENLKEKLFEESFICKLDRPLPFGVATHSEIEKSRYFKTEGCTKAGMLQTLINGMFSKLEDSIGHAKYIQKFSPSNLSIDGIYNKSNGPFDVLEAFFLNYARISPITQDLLIQKWKEFHEENKDRPKAKILHFCHSQGAIDTNNALMRLPEEIRKRVIVIAIAPAEVVPSMLCYNSFNYASEKDLVPKAELFAAYWRAFAFLDFRNLAKTFKSRDELILLKPHEGAKWPDHGLQSPTFTPLIERHLVDYDLHQGEYP